MDIPIRRLNNRLALQLPAELPLGLVFVVGQVTGVVRPDDGQGKIAFHLEGEGYALRCLLAERVATEAHLREGMTVRAGGHLAFDARRAAYYLLARDLAVVSGRAPGLTSVRPILEDLERRAAAASLPLADIPSWVQEIAPPEIRVELGIAAPALATAAAGSDGPLAGRSRQDGANDDGLTEELIAFLSRAMDSEEEVELTHDVITRLSPGWRPAVPEISAVLPYEEASSPPERIHWVIATAAILVVLLVLAIFTVLVLYVTGGL